MRHLSLKEFELFHRCTCEGGPDHPCLYPRECYNTHVSKNNNNKDTDDEMRKL